jgi:MFS family permease
MIKKTIDQPSKTKTPFFYGYIIVALIVIIQVIMYGSSVTSGVFLKPMINEFGWSRALISGAFSFSRIMTGIASIIMGGLNDRLGPRTVLTICGCLVGAGLLLTSLTHSVWQMYLFYVVIWGIGMGGVYAPQMSTIARWFTRRRNFMTGLAFVGGSFGGLIMPPIANWLISTTGWRHSFLVLGAVVLAIVVVCAQFLRGDPHKTGQMAYGETGKLQAREPIPVFTVRERSLKEAMHTRQFWVLMLMNLCNIFCLQTIIVHIVPHATDLGISPAAAANILGGLSAGLLMGSLVMGFGADRIGTTRAFIICFVPMLAVLLLLLPVTEPWMLGLLVFLMGCGNGGAAALTSSMFAEQFGMKSHGLILGFCSLTSAVGGAVGPFMAGYIFDTKGSYQWAFLLCGALIVTGLAISLWLKPIAKQSRPGEGPGPA